METYQVELTFVEPILGAIAKDPEIYASYIKSKAAKDQNNDDEMETVESSEEKGWTGFHMLNGKPILYDYAIKGFFKDACSMLRRVKGTKSAALKAHKKIIDGLIFIKPRRIVVDLNGQEMGVLERPLRGQTAKGERVTLVRSDTCPARSQLRISVIVLGGISQKILCEWLDYGRLRGLGQWRNASYGSFDYEITKVKGGK